MSKQDNQLDIFSVTEWINLNNEEKALLITLKLILNNFNEIHKLSNYLQNSKLILRKLTASGWLQHNDDPSAIFEYKFSTKAAQFFMRHSDSTIFCSPVEC